MIDLAPAELTLIALSLLAATVNGGLGYGYSSITVPVALLFHTSRVLNPALVGLEVCINFISLLINRRAVPRVWRRMLPMLIGAVPGVAVGSLTLAWIDQGWLKLVTYSVLLPLIFLQIAGVRRPIRNERVAGGPLGFGVGVLYAATTISGPPLALLFNNQGLTKDEFRAALALFRIVESSFTAITYLALGLYMPENLKVAGLLAPGILVGLPLGYALLRRLDAETFRRICMSVDAMLVSFGLAQAATRWIPPVNAYLVAAAGWMLGGYLLWTYLRTRRKALAEVLSHAPKRQAEVSP